jgi:hypothetical protein
MSNSQLVELINPFCQDVLEGPPPIFLRYARTQLTQALPETQTEINSCFDLLNAGFCHQLGKHGNVVRALCAESCACGKVDSFSPSLNVEFGCPMSCRSSPTHEESLFQRGEPLQGTTESCVDVPLNVLQEADWWRDWRQWGYYYLDTSPYHGISFSINATWFNDTMHELGCGMLDLLPGARDPQFYISKDHFCMGSSATGLRPLAPICPESCGCRHGNMSYCPPQCPRTQFQYSIDQTLPHSFR